MSVKERLHHLIEELSERDMLMAERLLRGLRLTQEAPADGLRAFLSTVPEDDEDETEEERDAVAKAWEEYDHGQVISHEDLAGGGMVRPA